MNKPLVSISCLVFNHAPYLRQCLDGFMMQKTDFTFEVLIHDDASTDGSADIIREYESKYPGIIKPIYETENQWNLGRQGSDVFNFPRAQGKYIALCEGDDYWTDPMKLQKQVDFLESNPEYSMCFHNAMEHWEDGYKNDALFSNVEDRDYTKVEIFKVWIVPTASVVFRNYDVIIKGYNELKSKLFAEMTNNSVIPGDTILFSCCASVGKIRGFSFIASVYRRHQTGVTFAMGYWGYINNYYYFQRNMDEPLKRTAQDIFFSGAPHMYIAFFKTRSIRREVLKKSLDISVWRTIVEYSKYFVKAVFEKIFK